MFKSAYWMHAPTAFCGGNDGDRHFIIILFPTHLPWKKQFNISFYFILNPHNIYYLS